MALITEWAKTPVLVILHMNKPLHFLVANMHIKHIKMCIKWNVYYVEISKTMRKFHAFNPVFAQ